MAEAYRFGFYVPKPEGTFDLAVSGTSHGPEVYAELRAETAVLFEVIPFVIAMRIIERNFAEIASAIAANDTTLNASLQQTMLEPVPIGSLVVATQRIGNFLAAASAFLGTCTRQMERDPVAAEEWHRKRRALHGDHFAYRLMYELRNFAQHATLPLSGLNVVATLVDESDLLNFATTARMSRDALLADPFDWGKVRPELEQQPPEFDVLPLADTYLNCMRRVALTAIELYALRLAECDTYLRVLLTRHPLPVGAVPIFFAEQNWRPEEPPAKLSIVPLAQREWLMNEYEQLKRDCTIA